jgi:hypothetical protein
MAINLSSNSIGINVDMKPQQCPICHVVIDAKLNFISFVSSNNYECECVFQCLMPECQHLFIAYYSMSVGTGFYGLIKSEPKKVKPKDFSAEISKVSGSFINIYNQSAQAETEGLNEICGVGYRKALEFLIKDYVISLKASGDEVVEKIKNNPSIYNVILTYVENENIKSTAKRAVWLGNDETHYTRKWTDKQIHDLKLLIELTTHWISLETITRGYEESMPG